MEAWTQQRLLCSWNQRSSVQTDPLVPQQSSIDFSNFICAGMWIYLRGAKWSLRLLIFKGKELYLKELFLFFYKLFLILTHDITADVNLSMSNAYPVASAQAM